MLKGPHLASPRPQQQQQQQQQQQHSSSRRLAVQPIMAAPGPAGGPRLFTTDLPGSFLVGGHRGMGANRLGQQEGRLVPGWRENTLPSFAAAAAAGASFVEFDVQVTADGVPVLWHDDEVVFGPLGAAVAPPPCAVPVAALTAPEFDALGALSARGDGQVLAVLRRSSPCHHGRGGGEEDGEGGGRLLRWRCERDAPFPRLEQLFDALPPALGFNVEVKMATPPSLAATPPQEVARVASPILELLAARAGARPLLLTSFDPDVCAALAAGAAGRWPVGFLSTGGCGEAAPHADARRRSVAAAIEVASGLGLAGVVLDADALAADPGAVAAAAAAGLAVGSYGRRNDDPGWVAAQRDMGVAAVIVDHVAGVLAGL